MSELVLLGDEAVALGALHAGLSGAYGYPGTPSSEILEYLGLSSIIHLSFKKIITGIPKFVIHRLYDC